MRLKVWISIVCIITIFVGGSMYYMKRVDAARRADCALNMARYNGYIASLGAFDPNDWNDADATVDAVERHFGHKVPICPSGGKYRLEYKIGQHPHIPKVVCSKEGSHNHGPAYNGL